jgi:hypothetical protein
MGFQVGLLVACGLPGIFWANYKRGRHPWTGPLIGIEGCRDRYDPDDPERPFYEQRSVRDCVAARLGKLSEYDRSDVLEHRGLFCVEEILSSEFVTDETVDRIAARLGLEEVSHG